MVTEDVDAPEPPGDDHTRKAVLREALRREADEWDRISAGLAARGIDTDGWGFRYAQGLRARASCL